MNDLFGALPDGTPVHRLPLERGGVRHFPDSPDRPDPPSTVLRPGAVHRSETVHGSTAP
ncbi:hypothetical protein [Streptomyces tropicalis]|uniref:hypothetical protein n=1 Tax=Streptomyces tropicalis TaxID=3034234 RepID=UPI003F689D31